MWHYLDAVPLRRIHDRWLSKYAVDGGDLGDEEI